jgi:hypothetical protein
MYMQHEIETPTVVIMTTKLVYDIENKLDYAGG